MNIRIPGVLRPRAVMTVAVLSAGLFNLQQRTWAQGCVAARGAGISSHTSRVIGEGGEILPPTSGWQASVGYRWLHSDRHFTGTHEDKERQEEGSEVVNDSNFIDLSATYAFTPRYSATLTIPFSIHTRSQALRIAGEVAGRYETHSAGIGDVRLEGNAWVLNPEEPRRWNVLLGLGVDAPTGEDDATDTFQVVRNNQVVAETRTVDQSIQPGDGGWGITLDLYSYYTIIPRLSAYANGAYTLTPEEKNGVRTFRSNPFEAEMSVADSYMGRVGLEYIVWPKYGMSFSLGGRIEGVPVEDAIGGSEGFRRPGYSIAIEPGVSFMHNGWAAALYTPVAVYRDRERSIPDIQQSEATGTFRHGDAAFADFTIIFSLAKSF